MGDDLGRRFLDAGGTWAVGMWTTHNGATGTVVWVSGDGDPTVWWSDLHETRRHGPGATWQIAPDLRAGQTLGCVLAQVRERYDCPVLYVGCVEPRNAQAAVKPWRVWTPGDPVGYGHTEAEALVAALEAKPPSPAAKVGG
jgi:hypothetical protein